MFKWERLEKYRQEKKKAVSNIWNSDNINKELLEAVKDAKSRGKMTDHLAMILQLLCSKCADSSKSANCNCREDMQSYAMTMLVGSWNNFDLEKSNNPFLYYVTAIHIFYTQFLNREKAISDRCPYIRIDYYENQRCITKLWIQQAKYAKWYSNIRNNMSNNIKSLYVFADVVISFDNIVKNRSDINLNNHTEHDIDNMYNVISVATLG